MSIIRNTANQGVYLRAIDAEDGSAITTGVTGAITKDGGSEAATATPPTHIAAGTWWQPLSQAETDAATIAVRPVHNDVLPDPVIAVTIDASVGSRSSFDPDEDTVANVTNTANVTNAVTTDAASRTASQANVSGLAEKTDLPDNFSDLAITETTGRVTVGETLASEREQIALAVSAVLVNDSLGDELKQAIANKVAETIGDEFDHLNITAEMIADAVRDSILGHEVAGEPATGSIEEHLARLDAAVGSRSSHTAQQVRDLFDPEDFKATGFATPQNVTDAQDAIIAHGDQNWPTATDFATPGDAMTLTTGERTAIADEQLKRDWTEIAGTVPDFSTLKALRALRNRWRVTDQGAYEVYREDGQTVDWSRTVQTDEQADPVTGANGNG